MPSLFRVQWRHRASPLHSTTLRLSNPSTDHTGSFPPFSNLFLLQDFSCPSEITAVCSYPPELEEEPGKEHLTAMSYQFLSFQYTRLNDSRASPQGCHCPQPGLGHKVLIHVHGKQAAKGQPSAPRLLLGLLQTVCGKMAFQ